MSGDHKCTRESATKVNMTLCTESTCVVGDWTVGKRQTLHFHTDGSTKPESAVAVSSLNCRQVAPTVVTFAQSSSVAEAKVEIMLRLQDAFQHEEEARRIAYETIIQAVSRSTTPEVVTFPQEAAIILGTVLKTYGTHATNLNGFAVYVKK